jgi:hypothetical protein
MPPATINCTELGLLINLHSPLPPSLLSSLPPLSLQVLLPLHSLLHSPSPLASRLADSIVIERKSKKKNGIPDWLHLPSYL